MTLRVIREHGIETAEGLPHQLPDGEKVLWHGRPQSKLLARFVLKTRWIGVYFLILAAWAAFAGSAGGWWESAFAAGVLLLIGTFVIALLEAFAWGVQRTTRYVITDRRLVMRVGVALIPTCS